MVRFGYEFNPKTMYQPKPKYEQVHVGKIAELFDDGHCEAKDGYTLTSEVVAGYNHHTINDCVTFKGYKEIANKLWPLYPTGMFVVDHKNRVSTDDSWANLRRVTSGINNLNQYRKGTLGYHFETKEWLQKVNSARAANKMKPLYLKEPPRNKYIASLSYKGKRYELGAFDTPEAANQCYLDSKEPFIQDTLRDLWTKFLFQ